MTRVDNARILVGVPVYRGAMHIAETLRSIQDQDCSTFRVLISVDDGDRESAAACESFLSNPLFSLVMQDCRLGWHGNINWLMSQAQCEFFCYWQQDDSPRTHAATGSASIMPSIAVLRFAA
jgi:glycosyltransferase involved in cell wall biosynthesis